MKLILKFIALFVLITSVELNARDFTFFVSSDPHYGYQQWQDNEKLNKEAIDDMNSLPGSRYPIESHLGEVDEPKGVVVTGDLTGNGHPFNWSGFGAENHWINGFDQDYEVNGNGRLRFPVYEGYGNHDIHTEGNYAVLMGIYLRNQARSTPVNLSKEGLHYSWDWEGVHMIQLNLYAGGEGDAQNSLSFLQEDLKGKIKNKATPIILFQHYDFHSDPKRWLSTQDKNNLLQAIKEYNVIAIFVGHSHRAESYLWNSIPIFNAPSVKENKNYFVVRVSDNKIYVHERFNNDWRQAWVKEFNLETAVQDDKVILTQKVASI